MEAASEVAFEASQRAFFGFAFSFFASEIFLGGGVVAGAGESQSCAARLSWRSPPRSRRSWSRWPDEVGMGATPAWRAKLESVR